MWRNVIQRTVQEMVRSGRHFKALENNLTILTFKKGDLDDNALLQINRSLSNYIVNYLNLETIVLLNHNRALKMIKDTKRE